MGATGTADCSGASPCASGAADGGGAARAGGKGGDEEEASATEGSAAVVDVSPVPVFGAVVPFFEIRNLALVPPAGFDGSRCESVGFVALDGGASAIDASSASMKAITRMPSQRA